MIRKAGRSFFAGSISLFSSMGINRNGKKIPHFIAYLPVNGSGIVWDIIVT
jgi:hypothetical protein